jgi:hypothetical protein
MKNNDREEDLKIIHRFLDIFEKMVDKSILDFKVNETQVKSIEPVKEPIEIVNQIQSEDQMQALDDLDTIMNFNQDVALKAIKAKG